MVGAAGAAVGTRRADTPASASAAVARQVAPPPLLLQVVGWLNEKSSGAAGFAFEASLGKL